MKLASKTKYLPHQEEYEPLIDEEVYIEKQQKIQKISEKNLMDDIINGDIHYSYELCKNELKFRVNFFYINCMMLAILILADFLIEYAINKRYFYQYSKDQLEFSRIFNGVKVIKGKIEESDISEVLKNIFLSFRICKFSVYFLKLEF